MCISILSRFSRWWILQSGGQRHPLKANQQNNEIEASRWNLVEYFPQVRATMGEITFSSILNPLSRRIIKSSREKKPPRKLSWQSQLFFHLVHTCRTSAQLLRQAKLDYGWIRWNPLPHRPFRNINCLLLLVPLTAVGFQLKSYVSFVQMSQAKSKGKLGYTCAVTIFRLSALANAAPGPSVRHNPGLCQCLNSG